MFKNKIYDIIPPGKSEEILGKAKQDLIKSTSSSHKGQPPKSAFSFSKNKILFILVLIIMTVIVCWFFSTASVVKIELSPRLEPLTLDTTIFFSTSTSEFVLASPDLSQTIIPAVFVEGEKIFTKEFPASETDVEEKAKGTIRVYNKHNRDVSLVEGTRFLSSTEPTRQFHSQRRITVPASGDIDVIVIASESGEAHNISPSVFSIPGLRNFSPPQLFFDVFGRSFTDMEGGRKKMIRKVTEEDLENARKELLKVARQEIESVMEVEAGPDFEVLDDSIELELIKGGPLNAKEGQEIENFIYQIKVKALGLKSQDSFLLEFAKEFIEIHLAGHRDFTEELLTIQLLSREQTMAGGAVVDKDKIGAHLEISTNTYPRIDKDSLREIVKGRSRKGISRYTLRIQPELLRPPRVQFEPFWARRLSLEPARIEIKMNFD